MMLINMVMGRDLFLRQTIRSILMACAAMLGMAQSAHAVSPNGIAPPEYPVIDGAGMELTSLTPTYEFIDVSIGAGKQPLAHKVIFSDSTTHEIYVGGMRISAPIYNSYCPDKYGTNSYTVIGNLRQSDSFCKTGTQYYSAQETGATLVDNGNNTLTYTSSKGTKWTIDKSINIDTHWDYAVTRIQEPNGLIVNINYQTAMVFDAASGTNKKYTRIQSVTRNDGLQLKYRYALYTTPTAATLSAWLNPLGVTAVNNAVDYCGPLDGACTFSRNWPSSTTSYSVQTSPTTWEDAITDQAGGVTKYKYSYTSQSLQLPTSTSTDARTYNMCGDIYTPPCRDIARTGFGTATIEGKIWTYATDVVLNYSGLTAGDHLKGASTNTGMGEFVYTKTYTYGPRYQAMTEDGTKYFFDTSRMANSVISVVHPEGDTTNYGYDSRNNVTSVTSTPKTGSTLPTVTLSSAGYDATCTNIVTCNKPNWVKDALGNQTDYTYDPVHGGVLTETQPAVNGVRPQKRYTYTQRSTWFKNASGSFVKSTVPIWLLTQESFCKTGAASGSGSGCVIAGDEVVTTYDYGPDSGPNNLFLRGVVVTADGQTHRTCYAYDDMGNKISETSPNAALGNCP